jgi:hypothetical protein
LTELEFVREACAAVPEPDEKTVAAARAALRREIDEFVAGRAPAQRRRRPRILAGLGLAVVVAGLVALAVASRQSPLAARAAAAADEALSPSNGDIVHAVSRTTATLSAPSGTTTTTIREETWSSNGPPAASVDRYGYLRGFGPAEIVTTLTTPCGQISYESRANLFIVSPYPTPPQVALASDPLTVFRDARRHGNVHFEGATTFEGIAAFKLVVTQYGALTTYIVRRDNGYPLETRARRVTARSTSTYVTTYSLFEHIRRTPGSEHLLRIAPHPGAFYIRLGPPTRTRACERFGNLASLTQGGTRP